MQAVYVGSKKAYEKAKSKLQNHWNKFKEKIVLLESDTLDENIPWRNEVILLLSALIQLQFEIHRFQGLDFLQELVMFHKPTRYLLVAGLIITHLLIHYRSRSRGFTWCNICKKQAWIFIYESTK